MVKPGGNPTGKHDGKKKGSGKPVKQGGKDAAAGDAAKVARAAKRREKRQSRAVGSKRRERQNKRKGEAGEVKRGKGKGQGLAHTPQSVVLTPKNPLKQQFNKAANELLKRRQPGKAAPVKAAAPGSPEAFFETLLQHVSPIGYFAEGGMGASGQFVSVVDSLEILAKLEKKPSKGSAKKAVEKQAAAVPAEDKAAEDKPNQQAITRAKKLLEERAATLPIFDLLGDNLAAKRAEGAAKLLALVKKPLEEAKMPEDASIKKVDKAVGSITAYVLSRLVKGLSSGIGGARLGHALALAKVLKETPLPVEYVNSQIEAHLSVQLGNGMMGEQKQMAWGALFGTASVMASGRDLERVSVMVMSERLAGLHAHLNPAREVIAFLFATFVDTLQAGFVEKVVLPRLVETYHFTEAVTRWSAEGLYLFLHLFTHTRKFSVPEALAETFATRSPAHPDNAAKLADALFHGKSPVVFAHHPRVHLVWDAWLRYLSVGAEHDKKALRSTEKRLRSFWDAVVAGKMLAHTTSDKDDKKNRDAAQELDKRRRHVLQHVLPRMVQVILSAAPTPAGIPHRIAFLADLGKVYPPITTELLKRCSAGGDAAAAAPKDPKEAAASLIKQLFELNSESLRQQLKDAGADLEDKKKAKKDSDDDTADSDVDEGDESEEEQDVPEEDEEMDAESVEEEDRAGYQRFAFNMRKVVMAEMKRLALGDKILADHPGAFQTVLTFFATHAFFSVPEGAVDSDGLMSLDTFPMQLRSEAKDHFFTLVKHVSAHAAGQKAGAGTRRNASPILVSVVKLYQRLANDAGCEAIYPSTDLTAPVLKRIAKVLTTGAGKCSKAAAGHSLIEAHHAPHFEALLLLLFFSAVLEGDVFEANPEILEGVAEATDAVGKAFTSGQFVAGDLLDALMTVNLRAQEELTAHLGASISKISLSIFEYLVADQLKSQDDIATLIAPLSDERFAAVEDGVGTGDVEMEEDEEDEEEEEDEAEPQGKAKQTKKDRELLEKQLAHARARCLQYIQTFMAKVKATPWLGMIAVPVARLAELSLPKVSATRNKKREGTSWGEQDQSTLQNTAPVLSQCMQVLHLVAKAPCGKHLHVEQGAAESVEEALAFTSAMYCKDKAKMFEREGQQLRAVLVKCVFNLNATLLRLAPDAATAPHFSSILATRALSAQVTEAVVLALERYPESVAHGVAPALAAALKDAEKGRPFHRKVLFEIARTLASKWAQLDALAKAAPKAHEALLAALMDCGKAFSADEGLGEGAWRRRVVLPPALELQVALVRYLSKTQNAALKKFATACKKTVTKLALDAEVLDLDTKSALRKAHQFMQPEEDFREAVQNKPRKPPQEEKAPVAPSAEVLEARAAKKRKREEDAEEAVKSEAAAASQKHAEKKKRAEKRAAEMAKKHGKRDDVMDALEDDDEPAEKPAKKAKKEKKEKAPKEKKEKAAPADAPAAKKEKAPKAEAAPTDAPAAKKGKKDKKKAA